MKTRLLFCLIAISQLAAAQVTLKFNPDKGSKYSYQAIATQEIKMNVGQPVEINQNTDILMDMIVEDKASEEAKVSFVYKNVGFFIQSPMMPAINYNSSEAPAENPSPIEAIFAKMFGTLINKSITATITSKGEVTAVEGAEVLMKTLTEAGGNNEMLQAFTNQYSEEFLKKSFEQSLKVYPDKPVKTGDSWLSTISIPTPMAEFGGDATYTLKSVDNKNAYVDVTSNIKMQSDEMTEQSIPINISGSQSGTMVLELKTGIISSMEVLQNLSGTISGNSVEMKTLSKLSIEKK